MTFFNARDVVRHPWCSASSTPSSPSQYEQDTGPSHLKLELDLQIALEMPGLPAATDFQRWAEAALVGAAYHQDAEITDPHCQRGRKRCSERDLPP
jgi:hypothetical protein